MTCESIKSHVSIAFIGHVHSGKSTTAGHLIYLTNDKLKKPLYSCYDSDNKGIQEVFKPAWLMDKLKLERQRCTSINITMEKLQTNNYSVTLIDTPGRLDFIRNMITGISQVDCAILVVSATDGEFEEHFDTESGQTREYSLMAYALGVRKMIVIISKMDTTVPPYSEQRYLEIKAKVSSALKRVGYQPKAVPFVPVSGLKRKNLTKACQALNLWYKGWEINRELPDGKVTIIRGVTFLDAIDNIETPRQVFTERRLRIPILSVYKISGVGTVAIGRVATGVLDSSQTLSISPGLNKVSMNELNVHFSSCKRAYPGQYVSLALRNICVRDIRRGFVCGIADSEPPQIALNFLAEIIVIYHPGYISVGYTPVLDIHTSHVPCKFVEFLEKLDRRTGAVIEKRPSKIYPGEAALVRLVPRKPLCVETYKECPPLGRFIIRDRRRVVAVGVIKQVTRPKSTS